MRILITNDDGISAPGLAVAESIAAQLAGPEGEVWVVAPVFEQSGVSHAISYVRPMRLEALGPRRFAVEGSPADCVIAGIQVVMRELRPDLVLSGVNRGHNVAEDTVYSGTVGAAMEASMQGVRAVALSQYYGPANADLPDAFDAARHHGARVVRALMDHARWTDGDRAVFYNVNFPPLAANDVRGVRATSQGVRLNSAFQALPQDAPNGRRFVWLGHGRGNDTSAPGTDAREAFEGHVTITPLVADLTAHALLDGLHSVARGLDHG